MSMTIGANMLAALVLVFSAGESGHMQDMWSTKDLKKASCEITWAYYNNNTSMMDELINKYGNPDKFNSDRLGLIHMEMAHRRGHAGSTSNFNCDAEEYGDGVIVVRGTLQQKWSAGVSFVAMNWEFIVDESGQFVRIIIDETVMDYNEPLKVEAKA